MWGWHTPEACRAYSTPAVGQSQMVDAVMSSLFIAGLGVADMTDHLRGLGAFCGRLAGRVAEVGCACVCKLKQLQPQGHAHRSQPQLVRLARAVCKCMSQWRYSGGAEHAPHLFCHPKTARRLCLC